MSHYVKVELKAELLAELMREGKLCAADISCLDKESKQQVWQLCLHECAKSQCEQPGFLPGQSDKPKLEIPTNMVN